MLKKAGIWLCQLNFTFGFKICTGLFKCNLTGLQKRAEIVDQRDLFVLNSLN